MSTAHLIDADVQVRDAVLRQLASDPAVDAKAINIAAHGGVVTLTGVSETIAGTLAAERAAKRVRGVRAVANNIAVRPMLDRPHADIAADVARALELRGTVPYNVQAVVHDGQVTLIGHVARLFDKLEAERAICRVKGVRAVHNHIDVAVDGGIRDVRRRIVDAWQRNADLDATSVAVDVTGHTATLTGSVTTWCQRDAAERAATDAPGIVQVDNRIVVEPQRRPVDELC